MTENSKMLDVALDVAAANDTPNAEGAALLIRWLLTNDERHPDRPRVQAAVNRYYQSLPGANSPVLT